MSNLIDGGEIYKWFRRKLEELTKVKFPALPADKNLRANWALLFEVWFRETSPPLAGATWTGRGDATFGPNSPYTLDLIDSPGMQEVKAAFCAAGKGRPNPYKGSFRFTGPGSGKEDYYTTVEWFVGSFSGDVFWKDLGGGRFEVKMDVRNKSGWYSGTRLPKSWQDKIKEKTGLTVKALFGDDALRGEVTNRKVRALIRESLERLPVIDVPDWVPFVGKQIDPKSLADVGSLPPLPSFGGDFWQTYQVRTTWACGK